MRGIILAGGTGSRLGDLTKSINKHLLPVALRPMIYWPLRVLRDNGISDYDITIVSSAYGIGQLAAQLGGNFNYRVQNSPGGIAQALECAWTKERCPVAVILGDNIFMSSPKFPNTRTRVYSNYCFLKGMPDNRLSEFGVPTLVDGKVKKIVEKPKQPDSCFAVTGLYLFGEDVFDNIQKLNASDRGELEIVDLLNLYAAKGALGHQIVDGFWGDAGTLQGIEECSLAAAAHSRSSV